MEGSGKGLFFPGGTGVADWRAIPLPLRAQSVKFRKSASFSSGSTLPSSAMAPTARRNPWIIAPSVDLVCITFGWAVLFLAPYLFAAHSETFRLIALTFFVAHRYFTFLLVYLDRAEFNRSRTIYTLTPIICFAFVGLCYYFRVDEPEMFAFWYLFNYFHFVRQKYGILRIYSGKAGWGHKRLDAWTTYAWGLAGFFYMFVYQSEVEGRLMHYLRILLSGISLPPLLADAIYAAAVLLTGAWLIYELRSPERISVSKLLFCGSVASLYGLAPILSVDAMSIAASFSHAAEYIALVGLTVKNKARTSALDSPLLSRAAGRVVLNTFLFIAAVSILLYGMKFLSMTAFLVFTYGTSFAHFVFDGMIWKLRRPKVAREVGTAPAR